MSHQLPELPEKRALPVIGSGIAGHAKGYTADQMRAYAELAIASVKRKPLSDEKIREILDEKSGTHGMDAFVFAREIEQAHGIGVDRKAALRQLIETGQEEDGDSEGDGDA